MTGRWILSKLVDGAVCLVVVFVLTFALVHAAPGSPFSQYEGMPPEVAANAARVFGLDEPLHVQLWSMASSYLTGDLGASLSSGGRDQVADLIGDSLPVSMELGLYGLVVALLLGLVPGLVAGWRAGTWLDRASGLLSLAGLAVPPIVLGPLLVSTLVVGLGWFEVGSFDSLDGKVLPALSLGIVYGAIFFRLGRRGMIEALTAPHVWAARARGIGGIRLVLVHVLPRAVVPWLATLGPSIAGLMTGSVVVERIFGVPGMSVHLVAGAINRDYPVVMGMVMVFALILVVANTLAEIGTGLLDPRAVSREEGA